jgi:hypothetical protein
MIPEELKESLNEYVLQLIMTPNLKAALSFCL